MAERGISCWFELASRNETGPVASALYAIALLRRLSSKPGECDQGTERIACQMSTCGPEGRTEQCETGGSGRAWMPRLRAAFRPSGWGQYCDPSCDRKCTASAGRKQRRKSDFLFSSAF